MKKKKSKKVKSDFVHLHTHSDMSKLDGCAKIGDYVKATAAAGSPAIALTDHGTMRGCHNLHTECEEHGIRPIHGIEFYVSRDMHRKGLTADEKSEITKDLKAAERKNAIRVYEDEHGIRDRWHLTVWAQNDIGLKNLFKLSSMSYTEGFYYKPRIDIPTLIKHNEGLLVATGCMSSPIYDMAINGKRRQAIEEAERLRECFGERLWIEVQPHPIPDQLVANRFALKLRKRWGQHAHLLATQDAHYVNQSDAPHHEVLLCIGTNDNMSNPNRFKFDGGPEFYLKTRKQMFQTFMKHHSYMGKGVIKEALNGTMKLADLVTAKLNIDYHAALLPELELPKGFKNEWQYISHLCLRGWEWRGINRRAERLAKKNKISIGAALDTYKGRLLYELGALKKQHFISYFLMVHDIYAWARSAGIMCGPGRGSVAGSLFAYLLGLTTVDPIEHGLIFERFINPNRVDMPDVDMDFEDQRRGEIIEYLRRKYGAEQVAQIATMSRLTGKQCLRDISRVYEIPYLRVNEVTRSIVERSSGDERASETIQDSFKQFAVCRQFDSDYPFVMHHASCLEGMSKNLGVHAAGVVVGPGDLTDYLPLEIRKQPGGDLVVTALDMHGVSALGLVKLDVLGLRTLTVLRECVEKVKQLYGVEIDLEQLTLDDPKVLNLFTEHQFTGIFQYDTPGADKICANVEFGAFEDVAAMTALNRPGTARSGLAAKYVEFRNNPKKRKADKTHPMVKEICSDTYGVIVYQEHVIKIFTEIAGFAPGTADSLRKAIAKKYGDETIGKEHKRFVEGAQEHIGMSKDEANKIFQQIKFFGSYGFNKTVSDISWVLRAGAHSSQGTPWITIKDLVAARNSRTEPVWHKHLGKWSKGALTPIAKKMKYRGIDIIQMDSDGKCRPGRLIDIHDHGMIETFQLKTKRGNITPPMSNSHRLMTSDGYKSLNSGLVVGDKLVFMGENTDRDYCSWWLSEDTRFSQSQRITSKYRMLCESAWDKANNRCEECGCKGIHGRGGHEVAHIKTPAGCNYDHDSYHTSDNLRLLCNSCHKKADCEKGQRTKRWKKGRKTYLDEITEITSAGLHHCYDLEMDTDGHNYVTTSDPERFDPVVSHNSHATAYGIIAYWGMWLKYYYPVEFYWSLMKNEPQRIRVQHIAGDAKNRHNIQLLPPDVSVSGRDFAIDKDGAIRGSLVDIKSVGVAASNAIMEQQPYADLSDFITRVDRRKCHKGVVVALAKSGALDSLLKNVRWAVEHIDDWWGLVSKKGVAGAVLALVTGSKGQPDYDDEERQMVAASVNPLAFGKHLMDAYGGFVDECIKVPIVSMADEGFFNTHDGEEIYISGIIVEVKYNQIGDFHSGDTPDAEEQKIMFWGARYANVNVECAGGVQNRVKFDIDIFDDMRSIIDSGIGTPVVVLAQVNGKYENLRARYAVDLEVLRTKIRGERIDFTIWEKLAIGSHPALIHRWKDKKIRKKRTTNADFKKSTAGGHFCGVVTNVKLKYDKNGNLMAFVGVLGVDIYIDVFCFNSEWKKVADKLKPGNFIEIAVEKKYWRNRLTYSYGGGGIRLVKKKK